MTPHPHHDHPKVAVLLVGGHSRRMGRDKFSLELEGIPLWLYLRQELSLFFNEIYISCRAEQVKHFEGEAVVIDQHDDIGPMGAIHSAFEQIHSDSIFFLACDLPYFKIDLAKSLYLESQASVDVIAAQDPKKSYPEPLVAIWKRSALGEIERYISTGEYALLKCLSALKLKTVTVCNSIELKNVNSPHDI